ncbi:hypothetical protein BKA60DRAFT_310353 [Fusarium oxysporum]|nr:hypothetical protein BKA60DRAFT_310353 [Fusarium oxysporum]
MTRTSQSTRPSPAPKTFQLCCDICGRLLDCVDSHCSHLISDHDVSNPFHCGRKTCRTHKDVRSLKRHLENFHLRALYICRCGRSGRKDKHRDHLRKNDCSGRGHYKCSCGRHKTHDRHAHEIHIGNCGRHKRGRPKKQTASSRVV